MLTRAFADQYKIHESDEDRKRQSAIFHKFAQRYRLRVVETPREGCDAIDGMLYRGNTFVAVAEAKYRNNSITKYPDYTIDESKILELLRRSEKRGVDAVLLVSWQGDLRALYLTDVCQSRDDAANLFPVNVAEASRQRRACRP